jgi:hypothetical protein
MNFSGGTMAAKQEDAHLILKLYELRREEVMRQARNWFARDFQPKSAEDIVAELRGEHSAYLRMITSYWEMACAMVLQGAIDPELFSECNGEHIFVYAKVEPYLAKLRELQKNPRTCANLEKLIQAMPNGAATVKAFQERIAAMASAAAR